MKLIAGKINNCNMIYYWDISDFEIEPKIGDYAVVQNMNDFDLVKVIAIVETDIKYRKFLLNKAVSKKALFSIPRNYIREN